MAYNSNNNSKVLFIARPFPPLTASGAVRAWYITKWLAKLGWDVTVVTGGFDSRVPLVGISGNDIKEELSSLGVTWITVGKWRRYNPTSKVLKKYISALTRKVGFWKIESQFGWAFRTWSKIVLHKKIKYDVVFATGSPFSSFFVADLLSRRDEALLALDYRDPWTFSPHRRPARWWTKKIERYLLENAAFATTVSSSLASAIEQNAGIEGKFKVISNGFDPDDVQDIQARRFERPAIVYAGVFYPPKRVITPVLEAMAKLRERLPLRLRPQFHYFGASEEHVKDEAVRLGVKDDVVLHGVVPRREVLQALKGAVLAPVITSVMPDGDLLDRGIVTGKIFEVLNVKTPILLIAPRGSDARIIVEKSNAGEAFTGDDIEGIANFIERVCRGQVHFTFEGRDEWAWPNIIKKLDGYLREALEKAHREKKT